MDVMMHVYMLALIVGPRIFHSPTLVLPQCTISLLSMWLLFIYLLAMLSGVGRAFSQIFIPKIINCEGKIGCTTVLYTYYCSFTWLAVSIRFQVLDQGIMDYSSCLWDSIHPLSYLCEDVPMVQFSPAVVSFFTSSCRIMDIWFMIYSSPSIRLFR